MRYSIDRFEGELAVLLSGTQAFTAERRKLPETARTGDILERTEQGKWIILKDTAQQRRKALADRRKRLLGGTS
ncbi:MAG: DUF3006 domain-containing protein [Oscillospiraceae bacterium]|nr:DUF3006 domain-containing protein [Oscillospiraceae bacterium]